MAEWTFVVGDAAPSGTPQRQLTQARGRVVTWRVDGPATAQFTLDGRSDECAVITPRASDLWIYRDGLLLWRMRILEPTEQIGANGHTVTFPCIDYRGMLSHAARIEASPAPTFSSVDQGQIPWQLIQAWQALDGGNWGITEGVGGTSGTTRDETDLRTGASVGEVIDALARREGGFEWEIDALLKLNRWHPRRGSDNGVVLDYGGLLSTLEVAGAPFGNAAVATGAEGTTPATDEHDDVATDPRGRWTLFEGYPSVTQQATLTAKAARLVAEGFTIERQWRARMVAGRWEGPSHVGLGDIVQLAVKSGWHNFSTAHRVVEITATPGEHGSEEITLGLVGVEEEEGS